MPALKQTFKVLQDFANYKPKSVNFDHFTGWMPFLHGH